jgi:hypothetical protein
MALAFPTATFDINVGESFVRVEPELDNIARLMRRNGQNEESIGQTVIHFESGAFIIPGPEKDLVHFAIAEKELISVYLGSFVTVFGNGETAEEKREQSVLATVHGSKFLAHELKHLAQFEAGEIPLFLNDSQVASGYENWPWEIAAREAEEEYLDRIKNEGLLVLLDLKK